MGVGQALGGITKPFVAGRTCGKHAPPGPPAPSPRLVRPLPQNPKPQRAVQPPKMRTTASWFFFGCSQPGQLRLTQSQKSTVLSSVSSVARLGLYGCALMSPLSSYSHHHYASNEGTGGAAGGTMFRMVRLDM